MQEFIQSCFLMPVLPATILLLLAFVYWVMLIVGVAGLSAFDFDLDVDAEVDADFDMDVGDPSTLESALSIGAISLNFLNIGRMPVSIWGTAFALCFFMISTLWITDVGGSVWFSILILLRNFALALLATKVVTHPLRGRFDPLQPDSAADLIGMHGEVVTPEVSQKLGQVRLMGESGLHLLTALSVQGVIGKGEEVKIVNHDPDRNVYLVERVGKKA